MMHVQGTLPAPGASDVATREVKLDFVNPDTTTASTTLTLPVAQGSFTFDAVANAVVTCTLVDIDGSGNRSPESISGPFTVTDTIPPPAPGAVAFVVTGQD